MSTDRNPRQQATEALSKRAQAVADGADQVIEKTAATVAQVIGFEVSIDKELENLALPEPVLGSIKGPLEAAGFSIRDVDIQMSTLFPSRRVASLCRNGSSKCYLIHIRKDVLDASDSNDGYFLAFNNLVWVLPSPSFIGLFSHSAERIPWRIRYVLEEMWPRVRVCVVFISWKDLQEIEERVEPDQRGRAILEVMGMKHLIEPKSVTPDQEKKRSLKEFLEGFEISQLMKLLKENSKKEHFSYILRYARTDNRADFSLSVVRCLNDLKGLDKVNEVKEFFDMLAKDIPDREVEIRQLENQFING